MPVPSRVLIPEVLPAVMPQLPAAPEFLPAAPAVPVLPSRVPADLPAAGREALAAALAGPVPGAQRKAPGKTVLPGGGDSPLAWDDAEMARFGGFLRSMSDRRDPRGRRIPLDYLTAVAVAAGAAGDDSPEGAAAWAASAPARVLHRLGAPRDAAGRPRRPDAATFARVLGDPRHAQQVDDVLCAWTAARARDLRPGMRRHLRVDGKALRGAARGGHAPMLLPGLWDDGTTAAQLPVNTKKTNEIPVFRDLLKKIPDLKDAVISAGQMHTQRKHAKAIGAAGAFFLFTIGGNQEKLFDAADALPWRAFAGEAWTVDRGHGRTGARTIKTLPPAEQILKKWPEVRQVFLVERYTYSTDGELLGAVAVLGITSLPPDQAGAADLLAYLRGHWAIEAHHYVRDVTFGEDGSRAAAAHQAFAAIRNAVTGAFRLLRVPGIARQLRASRRDPYRLPLQLPGLAALPTSPA
jgi:hypothetical protein